MEMRNAEVRPHTLQSSSSRGEKGTSQLHVSSGNCLLGSLLTPAEWLLCHVGFVSSKRYADFGGPTCLEWPGQSLLIGVSEVPACFLICRDLHSSASS